MKQSTIVLRRIQARRPLNLDQVLCPRVRRPEEARPNVNNPCGLKWFWFLTSFPIYWTYIYSTTCKTCIHSDRFWQLSMESCQTRISFSISNLFSREIKKYCAKQNKCEWQGNTCNIWLSEELCVDSWYNTKRSYMSGTSEPWRKFVLS